MACRRAADIDLAAFLEDVSNPGLAEFRAHYPACPDCAREVLAWTALHARLREGAAGPDGPHPSEEMLLAFEERPNELQADTRRLVEEHLALCRSCRDELGALRSFDFSRLTSAQVPAPSWRKAAAEVLGWMRALVLHPAFAYSLVLLLAVPIILQQRRAERQQTYQDVAMIAAKPNQPERPPRSIANEAPAAAISGSAGLGKEQARVPAAPEEEALQGAPAVKRGFGAPEPRAPANQPGWTTLAVAPQMHLLVGGGGAPASVSLTDLTMGVVLRVVLPRGFLEPFEIQVLSPDGVREMRERFATATGSHSGISFVDMRVPTSWLIPGQHQVVIRTTDRPEAGREVERLSFEVR